MSGPWVLVNGRFADRVPATDRGLQYGDGLFETIAVRDGRPCLWHRHLQRLGAGCERLRIPPPEPSALAAEARALLDAADDRNGVLKLIVTRGSGARGYAPPAAPQPTRVLFFHPGLPGQTRGAGAGVRLTLCETRLGDNARLAGIKHLNRLEQVLARAEWSDPTILDGIMCDGAGRAICGTMSNLYALDDKGISTPPLDRCGVVGTVRGVMQECARALGIPFRERHLRPADLFAADGLVISNALLGALPVARLAAHAYASGAVPAALIDRVRQLALEPETDP
jgi:4-amino-4-deoxychorismate lyase